MFNLDAQKTDIWKVSSLTPDELGRWVQVESETGTNVVAGELRGFQYTNLHVNENGSTFLTILRIGDYEVTVKADSEIWLEKA
ncbi:hypothetical protein FBY31_1221 [Arthrobacter sp. SLBN-100]|uniref:hypothetical protein n=1 Tax=Arthrobacter sp. SLBN-100 TaxID=2768450 RepID=UPI00114F2EC5|nr:hypothetical protein [Arthrobacter sp. SLBN-100]TQJ67160.1 hypothetical protein FBY31_1221 [Arthrobacter sp. SLBN-100]